MPKITVVAQLTVKPDAVAAVQAELLRLVSLTRAEVGCLEYRLHQDNNEATRFVFYENWQDAACLDNHQRSDHYKRYVTAVADLLTDKVVQRLSEIG